MCLALPGKLVEIDGPRGVVEWDGVRRETRLDLLEGARVGDLVLVHAGFALDRVDPDRAAEIEQAFRLARGEDAT